MARGQDGKRAGLQEGRMTRGQNGKRAEWQEGRMAEGQEGRRAGCWNQKKKRRIAVWQPLSQMSAPRIE